MQELERNTLESSEMVEQTFKFWFNDNDHIRSPFPNYIQSQLKDDATNMFFNWASNLRSGAKDELNDEMIGEKFEEIIFQVASELVMTEDERITITYPFLPRLGDEIKDNDVLESKIIDRVIVKEGDHSFLKLKLEKLISKETWETQMELPL